MTNHYQAEICRLLNVATFADAIPILKARRLIAVSDDGFAATRSEHWTADQMTSEDAERIIHHLRAERQREEERMKRYTELAQKMTLANTKKHHQK